MTTLFYPDISSRQGPPDVPAVLSLKGATAVCVKATEGTGYTDPWYAHWKAEAAAEKVFLFAYHFLHAGNAAAQAAHAFSVVGKGTGLMVDVEETTGSDPTIADETAFVDEYRKLGGTIWLDYLPHWYWQKLGLPSMQPLIDRGMRLVSSDYTAYSDTGPGWQAYGGRTPVVWQFSPSHPFNGQSVDFNAFKGTLGELESIVLTGKPPPAFYLHVVAAGNTQSLNALAKSRHTTVQHLTDMARAHLGAKEWPVFTAYKTLAQDMATAGMPDPAMPEGLIYVTSNP